MGESQPLDKAKLHYNWGDSAFDEGLYEIAIEEYTTAIQHDPSYAKAYANRGFAYRKLKKHAEAMVDLKAAARLGSAEARNALLKNSRANKIILSIVIIIVFLIIRIASIDNNRKDQAEEIQRQQAVAAEQARTQSEQARIKADKENTSFDEEWKRERQKKRVHDLVYGDPLQDFNDSIWGHRSNRPSDDPTTRMEMERMVREQAEEAIRHDRMMHGRPPF